MGNIILGALKSKTIWVAVATVLLGALYAPVQEYIGAHPGVASSIIGLIMVALRGLTSTSLAAKGTPGA